MLRRTVRTIRLGLSVLLLLAVPLLAAPPAAAQEVVEVRGGVPVETTYVRVSQQVVGKIARPADPGQRSNVGVLLQHPRSSYLDHSFCTGLASRGFTVLCQNGRYTMMAGANDNIIWDNVVLDVKAGVDYLRRMPGITRVVLLAHSGGGPLMSTYQAVAENGAAFCQNPKRIMPCDDALDGMTPADGIVLLDAHIGYGAFAWLAYNDPSVTSDDPYGRLDLTKIDPSLDPLSPENGYDPVQPTYSDEFYRRYFAGQAERATRQIALAEQRWQAIQAGDSPFTDNEPFVLPRHYAGIHTLDPRIISQLRYPHRLITANGILDDQMIHTVRVPAGIAGDPKIENARWSSQGTFKIDLRSFLSTYAVRVTPDYHYTVDNIIGIDYESSNSSTPSNMAGVSVPTLIIGATGFYMPVAAEIEWEWAAAQDKEIVFVEGASHSYTPCHECESTPNQFGDTEAMTWDYITNWINARFAEA